MSSYGTLFEDMKKIFKFVFIIFILFYIVGNDPCAFATHISYGVENMGLDRYSQYLSESNYPDFVTVAVIDSGVSDVDFLCGKLISGYDFIDNKEDGTTDASSDSHGTAIASIIADAVGELPIKIMPIRILEDKIVDITCLIKGIRYAVDMGADVINLSVGGNVKDCSEIDAAVSYAHDNGTIVVVSAGNERKKITDYCPAHNENAITVSAVDHSNTFAKSFSNYGETIDYCAPGVGISVLNANGDIVKVNGTSFSTAFISAGVAMVRLKYPDYTIEEIQKVLNEICLDLGAVGFDTKYGYGLPMFDRLLDMGISIVNFEKYHKKHIGYKTTITFKVEVKNLPRNAEIEWIVNNQCVSNGYTYTAHKVKDDLSVYAQIVCDGKVLEKSDIEIIYVKDGLFHRFIALIKNFFGCLRIINQ